MYQKVILVKKNRSKAILSVFGRAGQERKNRSLSFFFAGFTLIELLVVVLIIGILAAVAVAMYQRSVRHAQMAQVFTYLAGLKKAQEMYFMANGQYSYRFDELDWQFQCGHVTHDDGSTEANPAFSDKCYFGASSGGANIGVNGGFRISPTYVNAWLWWGNSNTNTIHCYRGLDAATPSSYTYYSQYPSETICTVKESNTETQSILKSMGGVLVNTTTAAICGGGTGKCLEYRMY